MEACPACTADAKSLGARIATLCSSSKRRKSIKSIALDESNIGAACGAFDNAATIAQKKDAFRCPLDVHDGARTRGLLMTRASLARFA